MNRRYLLLLSTLLLVLSATATFAVEISGLPKQINNGDPVTIKVMGLGALTDAYDIPTKATIAVAKAFMDRYPNVKLEPFTFMKVPGRGNSSDANDTETLMSMAAGIAPDVLIMNFRQSDTYIRQGFMLPLDDYFKEWRSTPEGEKEFNEVFAIEKNKSSSQLTDVAYRIGPDPNHPSPSSEWKEHWYALPPESLVLVLFRQKDKLSNVGINAEIPPKDWDEFYEQGLRVCDPRPEKDIYAYDMASTWFMSYMMWSAGSEILGPVEGNPLEWEAKYDDDAAVRAFQFAWKLERAPWAICSVCENHFPIPYDKNGNPASDAVQCRNGHHLSVNTLKKKKLYFEGICTGDINKYWANKVVFTISYMGDMSLIPAGFNPSLIGISQVPADPVTGQRKAEINSSMFGVNGTQKDPARREAAWAYVRFLASDEAKRIKTEVFVGGGYAKFMNPQYLRKFGFQAYLRDIDAGWEKTFLDAKRTSKPEPYGKNAQQIYTEMDKTWEEIKLLKTPDAAAIMGILKKGVARTNEQLFGTITPQEKKKRDTVALIMVLVTAGLFILLFRYTMATYGHALSSDNLRSKAAMRQVVIAWVIMLPALIAVALFQYLPLARGSVIAFQDYQVLLGGKFVGLSNFGYVLFNEQFWKSLGHTLEFAGIMLGLGFVAPVVLALLLHEVPRGSLFFRVVFYLPEVTSGVVVMLLWMILYDPQASGMLNSILMSLGLPQQKFLDDEKLAMLWVVLPTVWAGMGPGSIIYSAALQQIPTEYYEAADVDGAGMFSKLFRITLPFLKPLLIISFVGACIGAMRSFETIMIMTGGGPAGRTEVLGLTVFQNSFMYLKYGVGTAMGWVLATLLIGFTMFQLRYLSKVQFRLAKSDD